MAKPKVGERTSEPTEIDEIMVGGRMAREDVRDIDAICEETGWSRAAFLARSAKAMLHLIKEETLLVPEIVTAARLLREHRATLTSPRRPFPAQAIITLDRR